MNVPATIQEAVNSQVDKSAELWHILQQQMDAFRKDKRYGSVNIIFQAGKLTQVEVRDTYRPQ